MPGPSAYGGSSEKWVALSSMSSKCEVSTSDAIDGTCGGSSDRATRRSKSIDAKNGWSMMYLRPKLLVGRLADAGRLYTVQGEWDL